MTNDMSKKTNDTVNDLRGKEENKRETTKKRSKLKERACKKERP